MFDPRVCDELKEAQNNGNVIHLPPKEELADLLKARKVLLKGSVGVRFCGLYD